MNIVISLIDDDFFEKNKIYNLISISNGMAEITSKKGKTTLVDLNDKDFIFILNCSDDLNNVLKENNL